MSLRTADGRPYPLGATVTAEGTNFAVFSRHATALYLELFHGARDRAPCASFALAPERQRTGDIWHIFVGGVGHGQLYGWRADGPYTPEEDGHRFNVNKLLCDPYARALAGHFSLSHDAVFGYDRSSPDLDLSFSTLDSAPYSAKSVVISQGAFNWEDDRPLRRSLSDSVIYEVHVKGLTAHPSAAATHAGTYLGVIEKIDHLKRLGVTAVELLPVHAFAAGEIARNDPLTGAPLSNYWGYSTLGFFAPDTGYASGSHPGAAVLEFQQMVKALHRAGIEVILDVVFNHTGEGDQQGPTLSFRGLDNSIYYLLERQRFYKNYSGCGNTVSCNHPVLKQFILDALRYWVVEMHVDGFRFDLATILGRGRKGEWIEELSLLHDIGGDPVLRGCKLIAEAWDADGLYKVGDFPHSWAEWNGRFRDGVRQFVRGDRGMVPELARRLGGSLDLFSRKPDSTRSINFVTCHDGFTLRDLVSYKEKHNERNGEGNRDGSNDNYSANWGVEGASADASIERTRIQVAKNLLATVMLSRGTPMLLGGDERLRTQGGNNNAYCQDNELGWLNWSTDATTAEMERFTRLLIALRLRHPALHRTSFVDPFASDGASAATAIGEDIRWHGVRLHAPDWTYHSHSIAVQILGHAPAAAPGTDDCGFFAIFNAWDQPLAFALPEVGAHRVWRLLLDTAHPSPEDIVEDERAAVAVVGEQYVARPRSTVLLGLLP